ncbi:MAG: M16 family metallopeptidase [Chitinophagales bacterium]
MKKNLFFAVCILGAQILFAQVIPGSNQNIPPGAPTQVEPGTQGGYKNPLDVYMANPTQPSRPFEPSKVKDYPFISYPGDPTQTRIYRLKNGLTVYLSQNKIEPRIYTNIAVKAGSKNDPKETTGLAHYLEHMMFKGTDHVGTTDWKKERMLLNVIAQLYEKHRKETDPEKKKMIYAEIDKVSQEAAALAIPNEYDKMISSLGAKGTNAYTSNERTVYVNDIPSNELEKWLILESERFHQLVLRLFHTELEAVYEEYNMSQDRDGSKVFKEFMKGIFPTHQYGTQTTIGEGEHLKNPSLNNIIAYWTNYYVPNNMAICLSGDLEYDAAIQMIDKYFGSYHPRPVQPLKKIVETPLTEVVRKEVTGLEAESLSMGFRLPGANTRDATLAKLAAGILSNGQAGLIDLDLVQDQKVLNAYAFVYELTDYSVFWLSADPREGQTLEDCETLLLQEIEKLKKGEFDDWLLQAVVTDKRLAQTKSFENNTNRVGFFVDSYIKGVDWRQYMSESDRMEKFTKQEVMDFAAAQLNNYVIVYKRQGQDTTVQKVDKPKITPIEANRDSSSAFLRQYQIIPSKPTSPEFIDYKQKIQTQEMKSGVNVSYIKNELNQLFELYYILDMGNENDKTLSLAINYLPYLGTDKYTPDALQKEFFKYGLSFNVFTSADRTYVSLTGLETNLEKGIELFEHILSNVVADKEAYAEMVKGILKEREDAKADKNSILNGAMFNYAKYGEVSPQTDILSESELKKIKPEALVEKIKLLTSYRHRIFYYGQRPLDNAMQVLEMYHKTPAQVKEYPAAKNYPELGTEKNQVLFVNYEMVQAQVVFISKDKQFDKNMLTGARAFNEYFGSGLSSIVFQEIRETKALAYSAFASYSSPTNADEAHYVRAAVYTQADKMQQAIEAMMEIMTNMPRAEEQFNQSRMAIIKQIQSERITKSNVFWNYESAKRRGLDYDVRSDIYAGISKMDMDAMQQFFDEHIKNRNYTILVLGDKTKIDINYLKTLGEFKELTLEEVFGY